MKRCLQLAVLIGGIIRRIDLDAVNHFFFTEATGNMVLFKAPPNFLVTRLHQFHNKSNPFYPKPFGPLRLATKGGPLSTKIKEMLV